MKTKVQDIFNNLLKNFPDLQWCKESIAGAFSLMVNCYEHEGKLLVCGNGGSAADAEHIVGELMKGFLSKRPVSKDQVEKLCTIDPIIGPMLASRLQGTLPAISLVSQTALMTAFSNDVDADMIFAQQVYGYGSGCDILFGISTSGNSSNVIKAAIVAKALGIFVIGLTGKTGGNLKKYCDICICVPEDITFRVQEYHLPVYHALCAMVEEEFFSA